MRATAQRVSSWQTVEPINHEEYGGTMPKSAQTARARGQNWRKVQMNNVKQSDQNSHGGGGGGLN